MNPSRKILFVCLGNICRSPAAENVFRNLVEREGLSTHFPCDSAGTIDYHHGKAPDARMSATLVERGYQIQGKARPFRTSDFQDFDLILTMDRENFEDVCQIAPPGADLGKVQPFTDYCTQHEHPEVPDPYYGGSAGFELVADLMEDGCRNLLDHLRNL